MAFGGIGSFLSSGGGGGERSRRERDPEREMRRWINSAAAHRIFGPGSEWGLPPGAQEPTFPVMDYSGAVSGTHPVAQQAIDYSMDPSLGEQYGQSMYGTMGDYMSAAGQASAGALGNAYSQLMAGYDIDPSQFGAYATEMGGLAADNPYLQAQIDAANRDAARSLADNIGATTLQYAGLGQAPGDSRHQIAQAMLHRDAADRMTDTAANMRANAYGMGFQGGLESIMQTELANQRTALGATGQLGQMGMGLGRLAGEYAGLGLEGAGLASRAEQARIDRLRQMGATEREIEMELRAARERERFEQEMAPYQGMRWLQAMYLGDPEVGNRFSSPGAFHGIGTLAGGAGALANAYETIWG